MTTSRRHLGPQQRLALTSVGAAALLVLLKLVTGLASGSLGLLAEAAHSGTDLVAALLTFWALGVAARPADEDHPFGHGKAEHLAALGEAAFLAVVSALIGYQSIHRLITPTRHDVDAAWYTLAVVGIVLLVDVSRATLSFRGSRKHHSAALASNALHFASDFVGTLAVLVGLLLTRAGHPAGDAAAGLAVAISVIFAATLLMRTNIRVLMDEAPEGVEHTARMAIQRVEPAARVTRLRVRHAAGRNFIEVTLEVSADAAVGQAQTVARSAEGAIRDALPDSDVIIRVEPRSSEDLRERATGAALSVRRVREVHNVRIVVVDGRTELSLHLKLPPSLSLREAHAVSAELEAAVRAELPEIDTVYVHLEPLSSPEPAMPVPRAEHEQYAARISALTVEVTGRPPTQMSLHREPRGLVANITVELEAEQTLAEAHRSAGDLEQTIRTSYPDLAEVVVHTEPAG